MQDLLRPPQFHVRPITCAESYTPEEYPVNMTSIIIFDNYDIKA